MERNSVILPPQVPNKWSWPGGAKTVGFSMLCLCNETAGIDLRRYANRLKGDVLTLCQLTCWNLIAPYIFRYKGYGPYGGSGCGG